MSHKTIITAIELLSHKTIREDTETNSLKSSRPPQPPNSVDQLLQYLAAINGHSNMQLAQMTPDVTPTLGTPRGISSEDSSPSSSQTTPSYDTEEEET